jgi:ParB/RepB/Spo0J family partition protein
MLTQIVEINLTDIQDSRYQTRLDPGDIKPLSSSINKNGLQQYPKVRPIPGGKYEIIYGHRRIQAVHLLGWLKIPCIVEELNDKEAAEITIVENLQRENLNRLEEALAFKNLKQMRYTDSMIAEKIGKSRPYITNALSLLNLDPFLQACIACDLLTVSHIRAINKLPPEIEKYRIADLAIDRGFTVRETYEIVNQILEGRDFSWKREVPIENIFFPKEALLRDSNYDKGVIIIDATHCLIGGFEQLVNAKLQKAKTVEATVIYWLDWLDPNIFKQHIPTEQLKDPMKKTTKDLKRTSKFVKILSQLVKYPEALERMYPIHFVKHLGEYYRLARASK